MKTKRRHELQTNVLAESLSHWIDAVKPYSRAGLALVVAVVVVIFAWRYLSAQSSRKTSEGWNAFFAAIAQRSANEELSDIATRHAGTQVGQWARVTLADLRLTDGTNQLFADKAAARTKLHDAVTEYQAILLDAREPMLLERATFGLARAHEALGTPKDLEAARGEYRSIGEKWPQSPYAKDAARRADALDEAPTKEFYDWLARYQPPRPFANQPGTPGARPDFLQDPAADADLSLPSAIDDAAPLPKFGDQPSSGPKLGNESQTDEPTDEKPSEPTDEKPSEPTDEKPSEPPDEKPSEPTDEKPSEPPDEEPSEPPDEKPSSTPSEEPSDAPPAPSDDEPQTDEPPPSDDASGEDPPPAPEGDTSDESPEESSNGGEPK